MIHLDHFNRKVHMESPSENNIQKTQYQTQINIYLQLKRNVGYVIRNK